VVENIHEYLKAIGARFVYGPDRNIFRVSIFGVGDVVKFHIALYAYSDHAIHGNDGDVIIEFVRQGGVCPFAFNDIMDGFRPVVGMPDHHRPEPDYKQLDTTTTECKLVEEEKVAVECHRRHFASLVEEFDERDYRKSIQDMVYAASRFPRTFDSIDYAGVIPKLLLCGDPEIQLFTVKFLRCLDDKRQLNLLTQMHEGLRGSIGHVSCDLNAYGIFAQQAIVDELDSWLS